MGDRELLELAATAAGYEVRWHEEWQCFVHTNPFNITNPPTMAGQRMVWVPLDDDGDALRLAVELGLQIEFDDDVVSVLWVDHRGNPARCKDVLSVCFNASTKFSAARRGIVRAASEIGRARFGNGMAMDQTAEKKNG